MKVSHNPARQRKPEPAFQHRAAVRASSVPGFFHTPAGLMTTRLDLIIGSSNVREGSPVLVCGPVWIRDHDSNGAISVFDPRDRTHHVWINRFDPVAVLLGRLNSVGISVEQSAAAAVVFYLRNAADEKTGWTRVSSGKERCRAAELRSAAA